jgi:branched-chain amino acid transport system substrate-binding protein
MRRIVAICLLSTLFACAHSIVASAQSPERPITVGVLTDMGGAYADVSGTGSVLAAQMAIEDFGGSVLGKPIRLLAADHQDKPDIGVSIARDWFDTQGVDVIVDLPNSGVALAVQGLAREKNRISIISSAATDVATNQQCSPTGAHWTFDSYSSGKVMAAALARPGTTWFFLTQDYAGGISMQNSATHFIEAAGGKVIGSIRHPLNTTDLSSYLLQAQSSEAQYITFASAGSDLINGMKQAEEFDLKSHHKKLVGVVVFMTDLKAIGLEAAEGLTFSTGFAADASPEAAKWSQRFLARHNAMPNDVQAGVYSATLHYLKAVREVGTNEARAVMAKMREMPVNDMFAKNGILRADGRMVHDMYLEQAKKRSESSGPWDLVTLVKTIPGDQAFRPLSESQCPLVAGVAK